MRAQPFHRRLPRQAAGGRVAHALPQQAQAFTHAQGVQGRHRKILVHCTRGGMWQGQQRVARQQMDAATVPGGGQGEQGIDHAQAGADDAHLRIRRDRRHAGVVPGIDPQRRWQLGGAVRRQRPRRIAGGQHDPGRPRAVASRRQGPAAGLAGQGLDAPGQHLQTCLAVLAGLGQAIAQVGGVVAAWRIALLQRSACGLHMVRLRAAPVQEVIGLIGQRTHPAGRHVEQVLGAGGGVGHALGQPGRRFEQSYPQWSAGLAQELERGQYPGRAAADDRDVEARVHAWILAVHMNESASRARPSRLNRQDGRCRHCSSVIVREWAR